MSQESTLTKLLLHIQDIFKTFSRHIQDIFHTFSRYIQDIFKTFSRHFQGIFKTSSANEDIIEDKMKTVREANKRKIEKQSDSWFNLEPLLAITGARKSERVLKPSGSLSKVEMPRKVMKVKVLLGLRPILV